ncbi:MAG: hypothetical protein IIB38_12065 [Candidatus Hydrogenedentes bacterium]|nr:hypothetical protein [Candidatus Hydrogenedentota bacterium]
MKDARYFCDGFTVVDPDVIRVGHERVKAVKVDYEKNRITLDRDITWAAGTPVTCRQVPSPRSRR